MTLENFKIEVEQLLERELEKTPNTTASAKLTRTTIKTALAKIDSGIESAYNFYSNVGKVRAIEYAYYLSRA